MLTSMLRGPRVRMMSSVTALPYYGGKSAAQNQGTGKWIASMLPMRSAYAEPFAGMPGKTHAPRTEVLWLNYDPSMGPLYE